MSDEPTPTPPPPPPQEGPAYGAPPPPPAQAVPAYGTPAVPYRGPIGKPRSVGIGILLFIVTLGIYGLYWAYVTHEEMKRYSGQGLGGLVGLLIWWIISPVSGFLIPNEIKQMYELDGQESPVQPIDGLWLFPGILLCLVPAFIWYVKVQNALNDFWVQRGAPPA
jgi:Domain of unknown function (DUF4234)